MGGNLSERGGLIVGAPEFLNFETKYFPFGVKVPETGQAPGPGTNLTVVKPS